MSELTDRIPEGAWDAELSQNRVLAQHEAGHVVTRAALAVATDRASIVTFRNGEYTIGPGTAGMDGPPEMEAVHAAGGVAGEDVFTGNRESLWGDFGMHDFEQFRSPAAGARVEPYRWWASSLALACSILDANLPTLNTVAERFLADQWVNCDVLEQLTAGVTTVQAPPCRWHEGRQMANPNVVWPRVGPAEVAPHA